MFAVSLLNSMQFRSWTVSGGGMHMCALGLLCLFLSCTACSQTPAPGIYPGVKPGC